MIGSLLALAAAAQTPAEDKPPAVFGIQLGVPMSLPECKHTVYRGTVLSSYEDDPATVCAESPTPVNGVPWVRGAVAFPKGKAPAISSSSDLLFLVLSGTVEGVEVSTAGPATSSAVIATISERFGRPIEVRRTAEPMHGLSVPGIVAFWRLRNLVIEYHSIDGWNADVEHGYVYFDTPAMHAARQDADTKEATARTPL